MVRNIFKKGGDFIIKESYYHFQMNTDSGGLLLYNMKTGAVTFLDKKLSHELSRFLDGDQDFPSEFLFTLKNEGFLVSEEDDEFLKSALGI